MRSTGTLVSRIGTLIAIVAIVGVGYSLLRLMSGSGPAGSQKLVGSSLPQFAAPLARSGLELDSNVVSRAAAGRGGGHAACDVRVKGAFVSCRDLRGRAVVTFWRSDKPVCVRQVDELQKAFAGDPSVHSAAIAFKEQVAPIGKLAAARGWTLPVAVDRDAAAAELYLVSACPSTYFARDGRITGVRLGLLDAATLRRAAGVDTDG
jgi:hypothetical protein